MTRDDIIRMAYEASDGVLSYDAEGRWILSEQEVIQLAASVAAAEREACALLCDEKYEAVPESDPYAEADGDYSELIYAEAAQDCAAAIRARGEQEQLR